MPEPSPLPLGSQREQKLRIKISNVVTIEYAKLTVVSWENHQFLSLDEFFKKDMNDEGRVTSTYLSPYLDIGPTGICRITHACDAEAT